MAGAQTSLTLQDKMSGPLQKIMKAMDSTIKVMEQMNEAANLDTSGIEKAKSAIQSASAEMERYLSSSSGGMGNATNEQHRLNNEIRAGTMDMKSFAAAVLSAVGAYKIFNTAKDFLSNIFSQGIEFHAFKQASEVAFTTFLGDAETAKQYMDDMYAFALKTPFAYPDLLESSRNLIAFGMAAENTFPVMQAIGDAVAGIGGGNVEMQRMSEIFGMIQVQGKLTLMEVNRLGSLGVNAIDMLAESAGVSGQEIRKQISAGAIDAGTAISALVKGMDKQFGGLMDGVKGTWAGAIDSMKSSMRNAGVAMMEEFMKAEGPLVTLVQNITNQVKKIPKYIGPAVAAFLPLINMLNHALDTNAFDHFFAVLSAGITALAWLISGLGMVVLSVGQFFHDNWSIIQPILIPIGVALAVITGILIAKYTWLGLVKVATMAWAAAQWAVNAATAAFPGTWILIAFVSVIALVIYAMIAWADQVAMVAGAIVGYLYWLGAAYYNVIMFIANLAIAGAEWFANAWYQGVFFAQVAFITFSYIALLVLDAIGNMAIAVAEWFVNTWFQATFMAQMAFITFNITALMILDAIGNKALSTAEWFMNTWNDGVYGVQMAFHQMGTFVTSISSGVASASVGMVNAALSAISNLINSAASGINSLIGMMNNIPGVNISTVGTVDLKLGGGVSNFAANIGKSLAAPVKAANVSLGRMNTAGDYMSGITMPTAPGKVDFGRMDSASDYLRGVTLPTAPKEASFGRFEYENLGDAFNRGQEVGSNLSLGASDKLAGAIDKVTGLLNGNSAEPPGLDEYMPTDYDPTAGAGEGPPSKAPGGGKNPAGSKNPAGGKGGANPTGGKLDSIGKIDDEINIADEDLKMLRELADIKSIQNIVTLTPKIEFNGDMNLKEEADIDKIVSKIEKTMKDEFARSAEGVYS